jgi:YVTN family beta-propeller protein
VLYECLTGKVPFERDSQAALVYAHLMAPPPAVTDERPELAQGIDEVVATAMAKAPQQRYPSAGELVGAARDVLAPKAVLAPPAPSGPTPWRRRPILIGAGAAIVALLVLVVSLLARSGGGGAARTSTSPSAAGLAVSDRVARVSQAGSDASLAKTLPLKAGKDPRAVAVGEGSIWVANEGDGTVSRIEPSTNRVSAVIRVGSSPGAIAVGEDGVWVANRLGRSVSRIDPGSNKVVQTIAIGGFGFPSSIAAGEGAVWVGVDGDFPLGGHLPEVHKIDPQANQDVATVQVPAGIALWVVVTTGDGFVWAAGRDGHLVRIDPTTNDVLEVARLGISPGAITMADGSLWIATAEKQGEIVRVDPKTGRIEARVPGGGSPCLCSSDTSTLSIAAGDGIIWVTNRIDGSISRVVASGPAALEPIKLGPTPTGVAVGFGSLWVTVDVSG